ncbi:MAG TPA: HlyD family efflux transporter periplasmic adaptor subunit [Hyphomicrobiaceae bacterium]|nr:HlyD family efflux transporter periplasmic adaptor subunit [Hyphomicrobiaceae bacterium]
MRIAVVLAGLLALLRPALADEVFVATASSIADEKAVFATVETANVAPARARIGGTIAQLTVRQGDRVEAGQVVATVGDAKLVLQMKALDAQIAGLQAQSAKAQEDLARAQGLFERGTTPKVRLDEARTAAEVASTALRSRIAERSVIEQQLSEGQVLAPASGRVLRVPLTAGSVVLPGEVIATVAERGFVLRLRVPERHARFLKAGDPVRIDGAEIGQSGVRFGKIVLVYPQIEDGRVVADAAVEGLGDYFVSERIRVWISGGERSAFVVPAAFITTRFGIDYVRVRSGKEGVVDVPVQRGREAPRPDMPDGIEILSGVRAGDELVRP